MVDPCFPKKQQHDWRYVYVCNSYRKLYACIRIIFHSLKYHIIKASNRKKWLSALGRMQRLDDLCCWALKRIHQTVRIPCLTVGAPNRKVPDLYFKVVDPKLQVADLKAEVGSWDPAGSPQFNPWLYEWNCCESSNSRIWFSVYMGLLLGIMLCAYELLLEMRMLCCILLSTEVCWYGMLLS